MRFNQWKAESGSFAAVYSSARPVPSGSPAGFLNTPAMLSTAELALDVVGGAEGLLELFE
jgi:hypothetical protein